MLWNKHWQEVESVFYAWNWQFKRKINIVHLWPFPQWQGFPFVTIFFSHYLFNLPEIKMELAHHLEEKKKRGVLLEWKAPEDVQEDEELQRVPQGREGHCAFRMFSLSVKKPLTWEGSQVSSSKLPWVRLSTPPESSEPVRENTKQVKCTTGRYRIYQEEGCGNQPGKYVTKPTKSLSMHPPEGKSSASGQYTPMPPIVMYVRCQDLVRTPPCWSNCIQGWKAGDCRSIYIRVLVQIKRLCFWSKLWIYLHICLELCHEAVPNHKSRIPHKWAVMHSQSTPDTLQPQVGIQSTGTHHSTSEVKEKP